MTAGTSKRSFSCEKNLLVYFSIFIVLKSIYIAVRLKLNILDNQPSVCPFCMMLIYYVLNWTGVTIKPREHEVDKLQSKLIHRVCECPWPPVISRDGGVLGRHMPPLVTSVVSVGSGLCGDRWRRPVDMAAGSSFNCTRGEEWRHKLNAIVSSCTVHT